MKKGSSKKVAAARKKPAVHANVSRALTPAARLLADATPLSDTERAAFVHRYSDAYCDALGTRTKAPAVAKEASTWAVAMGRSLRTHAASIRGYSTRRYVFFVECIVALEERVASDRAGTTGVANARGAEAKARTRAMDARAEIIESLQQLVGDDTDARVAFESARGTVEDLAGSLGGLQSLAEQWLARGDAISKVLVADVGLDRALVQRVQEARSALETSAVDARISGPSHVRDSAETNRIEGRVLAEMKDAMRAFASANARNREVPKLVAGSGTRAVLAKPPGVAPAKTPPATGTAVAT